MHACVLQGAQTEQKTKFLHPLLAENYFNTQVKFNKILPEYKVLDLIVRVQNFYLSEKNSLAPS